MTTKEKYKNQFLITTNNKKKHKEKMTLLYIKAHGNEDNMPNWDLKPDYTSKTQKERLKKEQYIRDFIKSNKKGKNIWQ